MPEYKVIEVSKTIEEQIKRTYPHLTSEDIKHIFDVGETSWSYELIDVTAEGVQTYRKKFVICISKEEADTLNVEECIGFVPGEDRLICKRVKI